MCNQFTFYLVSATRYHSRTFHSNMSQMHSGSILAASHFPHLSLVACNWRWRCGGWLCVTMPCPRSRSPLAPCPATDWAPWSPNQSAVLRCPHCGCGPSTESCPRTAPRRAAARGTGSCGLAHGETCRVLGGQHELLPDRGMIVSVVDFTRVDIYWI